MVWKAAAISALTVAILVGTIGCSSTPEYSADRACSLDSAAISEILGTNLFTAESQELRDVPLNASMPSETSCVVEGEENQLLVGARVVDEGIANDLAAVANEEGTRYEYRGGLGYLRANAIVWTCGNVTARISVREDLESPPNWQKLAEPLWDQIGCLTYTSPGVAVQPPGWD